MTIFGIGIFRRSMLGHAVRISETLGSMKSIAFGAKRMLVTGKKYPFATLGGTYSTPTPNQAISRQLRPEVPEKSLLFLVEFSAGLAFRSLW
jgi:hypothetical protein